jgi:hypothetical protein
VTDNAPRSAVPPREPPPTSKALLKIELRPDTRSWTFRLTAALRGRIPLRRVRKPS